MKSPVDHSEAYEYIVGGSSTCPIVTKVKKEPKSPKEDDWLDKLIKRLSWKRKTR